MSGASHVRTFGLLAFIVAVAAALYLLDARPVYVVLGIGLAWTLAATYEWLAWRHRETHWPRPGDAGALDGHAAPVDSAGETSAPPTAEAARRRWLGFGCGKAAADDPSEREDGTPASAEGIPAPAEADAETPRVGPGAASDVATSDEAALQRPNLRQGPQQTAPPERRQRPALRSVPPPVPPRAPAPAPAPAPTAGAEVVRLGARHEPREWNLWDLERLAREEARMSPGRTDEWSYLFLHLRGFATARGTLPAEFDGLVRDAFGPLLEPLEEA